MKCSGTPVFGAHVLVPELYGEMDGRRGFFCDDESIRYPYRDSYFSSKIVGAIGFLAPVLTVSSIYVNPLKGPLYSINLQRIYFSLQIINKSLRFVVRILHKYLGHSKPNPSIFSFLGNVAI